MRRTRYCLVCHEVCVRVGGTWYHKYSTRDHAPLLDGTDADITSAGPNPEQTRLDDAR